MKNSIHGKNAQNVGLAIFRWPTHPHYHHKHPALPRGLGRLLQSIFRQELHVETPPPDTPNTISVFTTATVTAFSPVHIDPLALRASFEQLVALETKFMCLTHCGPVQPTAENIWQLLASLDAFVAIAELHGRPATGPRLAGNRCRPQHLRT